MIGLCVKDLARTPGLLFEDTFDLCRWWLVGEAHAQPMPGPTVLRALKNGA